MPNPDTDYDNWAERAIIADLEYIDEIKAAHRKLQADTKELLEAFRALVRRECEVGMVDHESLTAIRVFQEKHPTFRPQ